jgi:cytochrome c-type biogenesis protein CcmH/NrfG
MLTTLFVTIVLTVGQFFAAAPLVQGAGNTIEGHITGPTGRPVGDLRITLKNGNFSEVASTVTDGSGHFRFMNLPSDNYYVVVEPGETDFERVSQRVAVMPFRAGHGEVFRVDIGMTSKRANSTMFGPINASTAVVFRQDIPVTAKREFDNGIRILDDGKFDSAAESLKKAIEIFPDYYEALERLGGEYTMREDAKSALPLLMHAVEVNRDGWRAFYFLGIAQYKTNHQAEAIKSLQRAVELNPGFPNAYMWLGMILAINPAMRASAIESLEKAAKLSKGHLPGQAYYYMGGLYIKNNQYKEAADAFENLLKVSPDVGEKDKIKEMIAQLRQKAKDQSKK